MSQKKRRECPSNRTFWRERANHFSDPSSHPCLFIPEQNLFILHLRRKPRLSVRLRLWGSVAARCDFPLSESSSRLEASSPSTPHIQSIGKFTSDSIITNIKPSTNSFQYQQRDRLAEELSFQSLVLISISISTLSISPLLTLVNVYWTAIMTQNSQSSMRGLTQYIADLRACRVRELEEKRINKEMAHIRGKFKG